MQVDAVSSALYSMAQIQKKDSASRRKFQRGAVIASTAVGIARAFEDYGWPGGIIPAAAVAANGVVQLKAINDSANGSGGIGASSGGGSAGGTSSQQQSRTLGFNQRQQEQERRKVSIELSNSFQRDTMTDFAKKLKENEDILGIDVEVVEIA